MATEGKGPIVIPCYLVSGVPYVLEVDANGKLAVRAAEIETLLAGGLPAALDSGALKIKEQSPISGFATSANQATMITALQLIDDLRAALGSVNTDDLQVDVKTMPTVTVQATGGDKIHAYEATIGDVTSTISLPLGASSHNSNVVPIGKVWKITNISWQYTGTPPARIFVSAVVGGGACYIREYRVFTSGQYNDVQVEIWLPAGGYISLNMYNSSLGDNCTLILLGHQMDAP